MKLSRFLGLRSLVLSCLIGSIIPSLYAQTNQEVIEHDTVKARRYFERAMVLKDDLKSDSAAFYFEEAAELFELNSKWLGSVRAYYEYAEALKVLGETEKSDRILNKAVGIVTKNLDSNPELLARLFSKKGGSMIALGSYDSAFFYLKFAADFWEKGEDYSQELSSSYFRLGWLYMVQNEFDKASDFTGKSLRILENLNLYNLFPNRYNILAAISYFKADFVTAKKNWEKGLSFIGDSLSIQRKSIIKNLGAVAFQEGNYEKALGFFLRALEWEKTFRQEENYEIAGSYFNLAEVFDQQERYKDAVYYYLESLRVYRTHLKTDHPEIIEIYEKLGNIYSEKGNYGEALDYYKEAQVIIKNVEAIPEQSASFFGKLGEIYQVLGKTDSSYYYYHRSLEIFKKIYGQKHPKIAESHLKLALLEKSQLQWELALEECQKALHTVVNLENAGSLESQNILFATKGVDVLSTYAQYLTDAFLDDYGSIVDLEKALSYIELAIELIQQKRVLVFDQKAQRDFSERYAPVYEEGLRITLLLNKETDDESYMGTAFQMMEGSKAFTLNQSVQDREEPIAYMLPDSLLELERSLKVDISFYEEEILNRKADQEGYDTALVKNYEEKLFYRKRDFDLLKQQLEQDYPKYHQLKYQNNTMNLSELQRRLSEEELLIEYLWQEDRVTIMGVTDQEVVYEEVQIDQALLDQLASLNTAFNNPETTLLIEEFVEFSNTVFKKLLEPALSITKSKPTKLIIIPDGPLTQLNFDLLVQNQSRPMAEWKDLPYLVKDFAIATGHSATLFFDEESRARNNSNLLAFSFGEKSDIRTGDHLTMDKVRSADLTSLPGSAREIKTISKLIQGDYYYGQQASEQTFKEVASDYQILHLALHGNVDETNPDFSKLHLYSRDTTEDGQLHVYELYNMELNADLAVLSACNTGSGKYQTGEGIMSLGHAFSYAGVNSLLLTRWDLSDEAAPEIMRVFYRELKKGKSKSEALRAAKLEYLENASIFRSNPFYWGSFFVLGDDSPVAFGDSRKTNLYILSLIVVQSIVLISWKWDFIRNYLTINFK